MAAQQRDDERVQGQGTTSKVLKRRGILAAAGAVVAGIAATRASQSVGAATGGVQGTALILGANNLSGTANTSTETTMILNNGGTILPVFFGDAFVAVASDGAIGVQGKSSGNGTGVVGTVSPNSTNAIGVSGSGGAGTGVRGIATTGNGMFGTGATGVVGTSTSPNGPGVVGNATGVFTGVVGNGGPNGGPGIYGIGGTKGTNTAKGAGVIGQTTDAANPGAVNAGVYGTANDGIGVIGISQSSYGVQGISSHTHGVYAECGTDQGAGALVGVTRHSTGVAFQAAAISPATYAGFFTGTVSINGSLGVSGSKFAVVKGSDGQYRGMYAVESPECWFEDVGTGTLVNGTASIKLDPLFAQHVHADSYHVFLTEHGTHHHLSVPSQQAGGFEVTADVDGAKLKGKQASDLTGTFSWRVMAKRNDIKRERMPVWEMPTMPHIPDPPKVKTP